MENAIVTCSDNSWYTATCHRNYIFPTGFEKVSYSCEDGIWTPLLSSCKIFSMALYYFASVVVLNVYHSWIENNVLRKSLYQLYNYNKFILFWYIIPWKLKCIFFCVYHCNETVESVKQLSIICELLHVNECVTSVSVEVSVKYRTQLLYKIIY